MSRAWKDLSSPVIATQFSLPTNRAMQCPALDLPTGEFYVSQAQGLIKPESIQISRNSARGSKRKLLSVMRLYKAGHGSTISVLRRGGKVGIIVNAWGRLSWIPYQGGKTIRKGDPSVRPIWGGKDAYIDPENKTVCIRHGKGSKATFRLYPLVGAKRGKQIGKTATGVISRGPGQGYCTIRSGKEFFLLTLWDYGRLTSKPTLSVGSFTTGKLLYSKSTRVLSKRYTRQEPESGYAIRGVFHLGMSVKISGKVLGIGVRFSPLPPVKPPKPPVKPPVKPVVPVPPVTPVVPVPPVTPVPPVVEQPVEPVVLFEPVVVEIDPQAEPPVQP